MTLAGGSGALTVGGSTTRSCAAAAAVGTRIGSGRMDSGIGTGATLAGGIAATWIGSVSAGAAGVPSKRRMAAPRLSTVHWRVTAMPGAWASSRNRVTPSASRSLPLVRALTTTRSAVWPSSTMCFSPLSRQPSPARSARVLT